MSQTNQTHSGTGDNIAGDKIIYILGKSPEYQQLLKDIEFKQKYLNRIPEEEISERLEASINLNEAKNQLEQFKNDVVRLAETFTKIEINSERLRIAKEYFEKGNFKEANAILKIEDLIGDQEILLQSKKQLEDKQIKLLNNLQQNSDEWLIKAKLTSINYSLSNRFDLANSYFTKALLSFKGVDNVLEYAIFLKENKQYTKGYILISEAAEMQQKEETKMNSDAYNWNEVKIFNTKGFFELSFEKYEEAEKSYKLALEAARRLYTLRSHQNILALMNTLNNLGSLSINNPGSIILENIKYFAARSYTTEVIEICENIVEPAIEIKNEYGRSLRIKAYASSKLASGTLIRKASKIYRELSTSDPDKYLKDVIKTLTDQVTFSFDSNEAEGFYIEAIKIAREQCQRNPEVYLPILSTCLEYWGVLLIDKIKNYNEGVSVFKEALDICEALSINNPDTYLPFKSSIQFNLAIGFGWLKDIDNSIEYSKKAYNNFKLLREKNPEMYFEKSLEPINYFGTKQFLNKKYNEAEQSFLEMQKDLHTLVKFGKSKFYFGLVQNFYMLSKMFKDDKVDMEKSLFYANETIHLLDNPLASGKDFKDIKERTSLIIAFWNENKSV